MDTLKIKVHSVKIGFGMDGIKHKRRLLATVGQIKRSIIDVGADYGTLS